MILGSRKQPSFTTPTLVEHVPFMAQFSPLPSPTFKHCLGALQRTEFRLLPCLLCFHYACAIPYPIASPPPPPPRFLPDCIFVEGMAEGRRRCTTVYRLPPPNFFLPSFPCASPGISGGPPLPPPPSGVSPRARRRRAQQAGRNSDRFAWSEKEEGGRQEERNGTWEEVGWLVVGL